MSEHKPNPEVRFRNQSKRRRKRGKRKHTVKSMATEIRHLLPESTVKELKRIANRKRKNNRKK